MVLGFDGPTTLHKLKSPLQRNAALFQSTLSLMTPMTTVAKAQVSIGTDRLRENAACR